MKAYDFIYDEIKLSEKGFMICSFDSKGVETLSNGSVVTFNTVSTLNGQKHELTSATYEDCLETTIQICKNTCSGDTLEISPHEFRELTRWLNRRKFLKFKILDEEHIDLYYEVAFTNISRIEIDGKLIGLELEMRTNTPFALKEPKTITVQTKKLYTWEEFNKTDSGEKGESTGRYVTSYDRKLYPDNGVKMYSYDDIEEDVESNYYYVYREENNVASIFDVSHEEGYIYPHTEITILETPNNDKKSLTIHNALEDRDVYIAGCEAGEVITMNYPIITSNISDHKIQNDFNWNFFRIANTYENRRNDLITSTPCIIKIRYSPIVKVGL